MKGFLTDRKAAEKLGVSTSEVQRMIAEGELKIRKVGGDDLIAESDLERVNAAKTEKSTPPPINELAHLKISIDRMEQGHLREVAVMQFDSKIKQLAEMQPGGDPQDIVKMVDEEVEQIRQSSQNA